MRRIACWVVLSVWIITPGFAQNVYWAKDHVYINGKEVAVLVPNPSDSTPPSTPTGLTYSNVTATSVQLNWAASSDSGSGLGGYRIYRQIGTGASIPVGSAGPGVLSFTDQSQPSTAYTFTVRAYDNAQNFSAPSNSVTVTTLAASTDTTPPGVPSGLRGRSAGNSTIQLNWNASADAGGSGTSGYRVYRGGSLIASPATNAYLDSGLAANSSYSYTVAAADNNGNLSAQSPAVSVSTKRTAVFSDTFNRADTDNLWNANWLSTVWGISFNTARLPYSASWVNTWKDVWSVTTQTSFQAAVKLLATPSKTGIVFWVDTGTAKYRAYVSGNLLFLSYLDSQDNETGLANVNLGPGAIPGVLSVAANSSTRNIQVFYNGVQQINFTESDTSRPNSGRVGMTAWVGSFAADAVTDDFILEQ